MLLVGLVILYQDVRAALHSFSYFLWRIVGLCTSTRRRPGLRVATATHRAFGYRAVERERLDRLRRRLFLSLRLLMVSNLSTIQKKERKAEEAALRENKATNGHTLQANDVHHMEPIDPFALAVLHHVTTCKLVVVVLAK